MGRPPQAAGAPQSPRSPKSLERVRDVIRRRRHSYRMEQAYIHWIIRYLRFTGMRHPAELGGREVEASLTHLARDRQVAPATQNQAFCALLFLYREVLEIDLGRLAGERA